MQPKLTTATPLSPASGGNLSDEVDERINRIHILKHKHIKRVAIVWTLTFAVLTAAAWSIFSNKGGVELQLALMTTAILSIAVSILSVFYKFEGAYKKEIIQLAKLNDGRVVGELLDSLLCDWGKVKNEIFASIEHNLPLLCSDSKSSLTSKQQTLLSNMIARIYWQSSKEADLDFALKAVNALASIGGVLSFQTLSALGDRRPTNSVQRQISNDIIQQMPNWKTRLKLDVPEILLRSSSVHAAPSAGLVRATVKNIESESAHLLRANGGDTSIKTPDIGTLPPLTQRFITDAENTETQAGDSE